MSRLLKYLGALSNCKVKISMLAVIVIISNIIVAVVFTNFRFPTFPINQSTTSANTPLIRIKQVSLSGQEYEILTNAQGQTLYYVYYLGTDVPKTVCTGECTTTWHPLLLTSPSAITGVKPELQDKLTAVINPNGLQVQYNGRLLYTYSGDNMPGQVNGNGRNIGIGAITEIAAYSSQSSDNQSTGNANTPLIKSINTSVHGKGYEALTNAQGLTLYYSDDRSACTGECTTTWHPLLTTSPNIVTSGLSPEYQDVLAAVPGPNGLQVQYMGHFVYTYSGDKVPGEMNGLTKGWEFAH